MALLELDDVKLNYVDEGDPTGPCVVFSNSLGTNLHLWDPIMPYLPKGLRLIRYDKRGHGESTVPDSPYQMGKLIHDVERLLDHLKVQDCVFVGLSIGGIIAQGLATKRMDLIRAMVLSNTGAKIGTKELWQERIDTALSVGLEPMADAVMERWFSKSFRETPAINAWRAMLVSTPAHGYAGCSAAISGTDFYAATAALKLPTLAIAGTEDGATPPDLVRETQELISGSRFHLMRGAGHLPCAEQPQEYAKVLADFLAEVGHLPD